MLVILYILCVVLTLYNLGLAIKSDNHHSACGWAAACTSVLGMLGNTLLTM
jgi:hypothetical protein